MPVNANPGLIDAVRRTFATRGPRVPRCPYCGSFLDAPRLNPVTGRLARKCAPCGEWHPLDLGVRPDRSE